MQRRCFAIAAMCFLAALPETLAQSAVPPLPEGTSSVIIRCRDCGVIHSIREVQQQREGAASGVRGAGPVGLVIYIPTGPGRNRESSYVGAVGTREWQNLTTSTRYEFTVRMDNGDFRVAQKVGVSDLQVGDRVRLIGGSIERL